MADKTLTCKDCGAEFVFTEGEQQFYAEKVSQMNLKDAQNVEKQEKHKEETTILTTNFKRDRANKSSVSLFF